MALIPITELAALAADALRASGASETMARVTAKYLVAADAQVLATHGVMRVPSYCSHLKSGRANGAAAPRIASEKPAVCLIDAGNGVGFEACEFAIGQAIERASQRGIEISADMLTRFAFILLSFGLLEAGIGATTSLSIPSTAPNGAAEEIPATLARPDGEGPFPAVIIMHDCSGLGPVSSGAPGRWAKELLAQGYVVLIGEKDDWTPAEPCRRLADTARDAGHPVSIKVYPDAYHSFDSNNPVRYVGTRVNPNARGGRGATTGGNPNAWAGSIREVTAFFGKHVMRAKTRMT